MDNPTVTVINNASRSHRDVVAQVMLERIVYVGETGDGGIPPIPDDTPRFVLTGTPEEFLSALSG